MKLFEGSPVTAVAVTTMGVAFVPEVAISSIDVTETSVRVAA
jgi:hypothetical protein